jgi:DNA-binding MarR family transcriptional regulator
VHLDAWRALLRAHAALTDQLEHEMVAAVELPLAWYEVLLTLDQAPGGQLRLQKLISSALMTKSGVTRLIDRMEAAGLVSRAHCPMDRRGAYAVLTDAGREKLRRASPIHLRGIEAHFARHLDPERAATLRDSLNAIANALGHPELGPCGAGGVAPVAEVGALV